MKLIYRGIEYEYAPVTVEVTTEGVCGKYRGAQWECHYSQYAPVTRNAAELKYRGAAYYSGNPAEIEKLKQHKKLNSIFATDKNLFNRDRTQNNELTKTHLANLQRNLQHRLEVAKQSRDVNLIRILEDEASQLTMNNH